jgi:DNA-directed RNA polymerase I subunit RPA2
MDAKSHKSGRTSRSAGHQSSAGRSAGHASAASSTPSGALQVAAAKAADTPDEPMDGHERLSHVRQAVTRIQHGLERCRHYAGLEPTAANATPVDCFIAELQAAVKVWLTRDGGASKKGKAARKIEKPAMNDARHAGAVKLAAQLDGLLAAHQDVAAAGAAQPSISYPNVRLQVLENLRGDLADVVVLLAPTDASKPLLSRRKECDALLKEAVNHYVEDMDSMHAVSIPAYVRECIQEGVVFSATIQNSTTPAYGAPKKEEADDEDDVKVEAAEQRKSKGGKPKKAVAKKDMMVGLFLLDFCTGVTPGRSARAVLEHLRDIVTTVTVRVTDESRLVEVLLRELAEKEAKGSTPDNAQLRLDHGEQQAALGAMLAAARNAAAAQEEMRLGWAAKEEELLQRAIGGGDQDALVKSKRLEMSAVVARAQRVAADLQSVALPFLCPQYYRRRGKTYDVPCSVRLGLRLFDYKNGEFITVSNLNAAVGTDAHGAQAPVHPELLPSKDEIWTAFDRFPELVKGERCVIKTASEQQLMQGVEEQRETGGYFIINGGERIARALLMQRSNVPINILRERFADAGPNFSPKAVVMRSRRKSGITTVNYFYYATTGEVVFSFARRLVWHIPVALLLFSMKSVSASELFSRLTVDVDDEARKARVEAFIAHHVAKPYGHHDDLVSYLAVIGRMYRASQQASNIIHFIPELGRDMQPHTDAWYGLFMLRRSLLPHLNCDDPTPETSFADGESVAADWPGAAIRGELEAKFNVLIEILRQLYDFVDGATGHQGNDVPAFQEVFSPSQLMVAAVETSTNNFLAKTARGMAYSITEDFYDKFIADPASARHRQKLLGYLNHAGGITTTVTGSGADSSNGPMVTLHKLLSTGNFKAEREEDFFMPQNSGWIVMAEHLNFFRFFEQLRTLHRGKKISEMRSSDVRKYPAEGFGFICMVHSPDGEDCGIVNFMSTSAVVTQANRQTQKAEKRVRKLLLDATDVHRVTGALDGRAGGIPLWWEGRVFGHVSEATALRFVAQVRALKVLDHGRSGPVDGIALAEVVYVPKGFNTPPGVFLFTDCCRLMRPVRDLKTGKTLNIGTWEQVWMDIAAVPSDLTDARRDIQCKYDYIELSGSNLISLTSTTIPFFEHNCSPRNLFQCGLSKQSAGTQLQAAHWRKEAKLFRHITPQRYIVRTLPMDEFGLDDFTLGVNAVVAVMAYTGYDMDDAVIINQTAVDRGILNAMVTISKVIDADEVDKKSGKKASDDEALRLNRKQVFHNIQNHERFCMELDDNGLPPKRSPASETKFNRDHTHPTLTDHSAVYCKATRVDAGAGYHYADHRVTKWMQFDKGEAAWIHAIIPLKYDGPDVTKALFIFRVPRPPMVGDKFSSRHGQKGTLPLHLHAANLPFTARGMVPDVIINPHAFPSRMTVGMILEMVAGKLASSQGRFYDNSAWSVVDESTKEADDIGASLAAIGFSKHGREELYCGMSGEHVAADVFVGVCGYQRLRHMVNDKWQSRATTDAKHRAMTKTGQPVKGRKKHGGVRIGEMERDGLLSHGIAEVVHDRLLQVSDKTKAYICFRCGSLVSIYEKQATKTTTAKECRFCETEGGGADHADVKLIDIPQVLRHWAAELTGVGVRVAFKISDDLM